MQNGKSFTFLLDYLTEALGSEIRQIGANDERCSQRIVGTILDRLRYYLYNSQATKKYVLRNDAQSLHVFNGKYYEPVGESFLSNVIAKVLERIEAGIAYRVETPNKLAGILSREILSVPECKFNPNRRYIAFNNCILDTEKDKVLEFDDKYITDVCLDFDYDPSRISGLWDKFICQTFPIEGFRDTFQWFCGALLVNRRIHKIEYALFIVGPGGNGKSVALDSIANMFGGSLIAKFSTTELFDCSNQQQNIAALDCKIANFTDDIDKKLLSGGRFKTFVSGGTLTGRMLYKEPCDIYCPFLVCAANEMPPTADDTEGHHRRILPLKSTDHTYRGKERDTSLTYKLSTTESKQAIFNWLYEGFKRVKEDNYNLELPSCVVAFKNSVRDNSNNLRRWVSEKGYTPCGKEDDGVMERPVSEFFSEYEEFCASERIKEKNVKSKSNFKDAMCVIGFLQKRKSDGWYLLYKIEEKVYSEDGEIIGVNEIGGGLKPDADLPF
jgi:P4 family phage/plasmid primase-like protien